MTTFERSTFVWIVEHLTKTQRNLKSIFNYVFGNLAYDNTRIFKTLIDREIEDIHMRNDLHKKLDAVVEYLKFRYSAQMWAFCIEL